MKVRLETPIPEFTPTDLCITIESAHERDVLRNAIEHYSRRHAKLSEQGTLLPILEALGA